jgi:nitrile hydratase
MNGVHDLGGMMNFGPVDAGSGDRIFHEAWESRAFGLAIAANAMGLWNLDVIRSARESVDPIFYLSHGYFDIWLEALEHLVVSSGLVTKAEIDQGKALEPAKPVPRVFAAEIVADALKSRAPYDRPADAAPRFAPGDQVRCRNLNPTGHTRLPRYVRGKAGIVEKVHGAFVFPDSNAVRQGEAPQWLYTVRFSAGELWGEGADKTLTMSIDAWESYLE